MPNLVGELQLEFNFNFVALTWYSFYGNVDLMQKLHAKMQQSAFQQKDPAKFSSSDWHTANHLLTSSSNRQRQISHDIRQQSETTRNVKGKLAIRIEWSCSFLFFSTDNITHWTQHDTNTNLDFRVRDVDEWKTILTRTLQNVETEIDTVR